ncbi:MAG: NUDIX domain-containing protein [Acidimicrobiia bacterium]|nr:NUDIX domain-containing protein [Acidimicrobiia bacterium]
MAISDYLRQLRERIGHELVLLPAVSVLIWDDDGNLLLMREAQTGRWQTVGGMIDPDESPSDAALREAEEETGLTVQLQRLRTALGGPGYRVHYPNGDECSYVSIVFDAVVVSGELAGDDEVAELRWFRGDEIDKLELDPLNRHLLRDVGVLSGQPG